MLLALVLCMEVATLLALASAMGPQMCKALNGSKQYASPVLDSLQCYNDYRSYIRCSWREGAQTASHAPLSLHHKNLQTNMESPCVPYGSPEPLSGGQRAVRCQHRTILFVIGLEDAFFFKVPHSPQLSRTLTLSEHVRVRPPHGLSQTAVEGGGWLLHWNVSYSPEGSVYPRLNYQVAYRQPSQEWTVLEVSERKLKIEMTSLMPGCWYEARVRARCGKGPWSEWGSPVAWKTEEAELPGPVDLQCVYDGETEVSCSWGLKRELAQFVTYSLSYWPHHGAPFQQCCSNPKLSDNPEDPLLKFSCSFYLDTPHRQIQVKLTPTYNMKIFSAHKMVRLPTLNRMQVKEKGDDWELRWTPPTMGPVPFYFQIRYRRTDTLEDMQQYNFSQDIHSFFISTVSLRPNTQYEAQVRAVIQPNVFNGSPSEWAEPVRWTTRPASWSFSITTFVCVITAVSMTILFFVLVYTLPMCQRRFRVWKVSIPSPLKSKVLEGLVKVSLAEQPAMHKELENAHISSIQVLEAARESHICPKLVEDLCQPVWLASADDSGTYKCIAQQGWEVSTDHGGEVQDKLSKGWNIPFSFHPCLLPLPATPDLGQLYVEDSSYVPTTQPALLPCVSDYVEVPVSKARWSQEDPKEAALQRLVEPDSLAYTQAPLP